MRQTLAYNTNKKNEVIPITTDIVKAVKKSKVKNGTLFIYSMHTTLGTIMQEAVETNLCQDIIDQLTKIVEDDGTKYKHTCAMHPSGTCKQDDVNGPSHVRQLLTNQSLVIDVNNGKLNLGRWQDIALLELDGPRQNRQIVVKIIED